MGVEGVGLYPQTHGTYISGVTEGTGQIKIRPQPRWVLRGLTIRWNRTLRTRLQDARRFPMDLYDFDDSTTDPEPARKRRKKKKNNLVVMSLLLILGIATTTCYLYGIGPWKASHVRAFYTSTKFMEMECWTAEEQTVSLPWIP